MIGMLLTGLLSLKSSNHLNAAILMSAITVVDSIDIEELLFIHCHMIVEGYYGFMLVIRVSVHLSYICLSMFSFPDYNE